MCRDAGRASYHDDTIDLGMVDNWGSIRPVQGMELPDRLTGGDLIANLKERLEHAVIVGEEVRYQPSSRL